MTVQPDQPLERLLAAWSRMRGDARTPAHAALRPEALRFILPDICLIDVLDDGGFRFRLVGTGIVERLRHDPTGKPLDVLGRQMATAATVLFAETVDKAVPMSASGRLLIDGHDRLINALCLPLAGDDGAIKVLLVGIEFRRWSEVEAEPPQGELRIGRVQLGA